MTCSNSLDEAHAMLDECDAALGELEARCCVPDRSPRMKALADTFSAARSSIERVDADSAAIDQTFEHLEEAASQVGWLQVGCCAPDRLPLYHLLLERLATTRASVSQAVADVR